MSERKRLLGARIKELRKRAGLSQDQLAERVGIRDSKYLSRIEVGKRYPSLDTLEKIADALHVGDEGAIQLPTFRGRGRYPKRCPTSPGVSQRRTVTTD